jgi:hypothetical protein
MSNIFIEKKKENKSIDTTNSVNISNNKNTLGIIKHCPPATKEWHNSIYSYNKNYAKFLPVSDKIISNLIKSYFDLFYPLKNKEIKKSSFKRKLKFKRLMFRLKRSSVNKIFISKAELKHTNSKVIATLYTYNAQEKYLTNKIKNLDTSMQITNKVFLEKIKLIKFQVAKIAKQVMKEKSFLLNNSNITLDNFKLYETLLYKNFIKKSLKKEILAIYYLRLLYFNKSKFEYTRLFPLSKIISKIYGKKVEFNIVNLKYIYLNSDIYSQSIAIKLKNRKSRLLRVIKSCMSIVNIPNLNKLDFKYDINNLNKNLYNGHLKRFYAFNTTNKDILNQLLLKMFNKNQSLSYVEKTVLNSIRYKPVTGVRTEISGRISRRFTASRSVFKFMYKGSLKDIDSSYKSLSSTMLRGYVKPNTQYTKISSKTRNGAFGLKG